MQVNQPSLTDFLTRQPITQETISEFRDRALQVVDHAVDVFFKPTREEGEGHAAKCGLADLELALRSYQQRVTDEQTDIQAAAKQTKASLQLPKEGPESLTDAPSVVRKGHVIHEGIRHWGEGFTYDNSGELRDAAVPPSLVTLASRLSRIIPLYNGVVMAPGPLSATVLNHIKACIEYSANETSSASSVATQRTFRLLGGSHATMVGGSSFVSSAKGSGTSITVDEDVVRALSGIRTELDSLRWQPGTQATYSIAHRCTERENVHTEKTHLVRRPTVKTHWEEVYGSMGWAEQTVERVPVPWYPDKMNTGAANSNQGLTVSKPGDDLVDLVDQSSLTPELVDQLKARSAAILDSAEQTFFDKKREHADGERSYHELIALRRALNLAGDKFGAANAVKPQIALLDEVIPLYACVAREPGEMSSSVRNFAREIASARMSHASSSSSVSSSTKVGLSGVGYVSNADFSSSSGSASMVYETTTTDQRVAPQLHNLQIQLAQMRLGQRDGVPTLTIPVPMETA